MGSKRSPQFWILSAFLTLLFATGGASRIDVQSLIILRPVSVMVCAIALMSVRREHLLRWKWLLVSAVAVFILSLLHLIPLPPFVWQSFPGREDLISIEKLADLSNVWRPLTLTPINGWHSLISLFVPLAIILLGIQLDRNELFQILPLLIVLTAISGVIGLLQVIGDPQGSLYFYRITNNGAAVGLFSNRNHAAVLLGCLFPLLAVYVSTAKLSNGEIQMRATFAAAVATVLVPLILVTGSRSGLVIGCIGILAAGLLYKRPIIEGTINKINSLKNIYLFVLIVIIILGFVTYYFSRAEAIVRIFSEVTSDDGRIDYWKVSAGIFHKYFPWGSGAGSFVEVYQIAEPSIFLSSSYVNRAHNDWVEVAITFGLPGLILLALFICVFVVQTYKLWFWPHEGRRDVAFGRLASVCIFMIAVASISDYPLRTPTIMGVFAILVLWFDGSKKGRSPSGSSEREEF